MILIEMEINNYENYFIYSDGKVFSKNGKFHKNKERFLKEHFNGRYYFYVLSKDGKRKNYLTHRLIAEHYIPNPDNKPCVDHINRIKTDNRIENLRWVTHKENSKNYGCFKTNISGHRNISWSPERNKWMVNIKGKKVKRFSNKIDALCYKYIRLLQENNSRELCGETSVV